jgi:flagellar motor switch protein FliN/FliY
MPDETPEPVNPASESDDSAEKIAEEALRAAEQAAGALQSQTAPAPNAATAALLAATKAAIASAKGGTAPPAANAPPARPPVSPAPAVRGSATPQAPAQALPLDLPVFAESRRIAKPEGIDMLSDVNLDVKIELGRTRMFVEDVLRLGEGSVVELDKLAGDPVDVFVNERLVARGEVLVLNENFCVRIHEIVDPAATELRGKTA